MNRFPLALALALAPVAAPAAVFIDSGALALSIPDDRNTGVAVTLDVPTSVTVQTVSVALLLSVPTGSDGWLGDLYAYVRHDSGFAVLLNRPGRDDGRIAGYDDSQGVRVSFADSAANGDVHSYRLSLFGDETIALPGALSGLWEPDGRAGDPGSSQSGDGRTAMLDTFAGQDGAGTWTLFVADLSSGGLHQLDGWSLMINGAPVIPEPASVGWTAGAVLVAWLGLRRRRPLRPRANP